MQNLRILFLSDAHFKVEKNYSRTEILEHIATYVAECKPDLICFTGDLAQSGRPEEYEEAVASWIKVRDACPTSKFVWVPGNHDLARQDLPLSKTYVRGISCREEIDALLDVQNRNPELMATRQSLAGRFSSWMECARKFSCEGVSSIEKNLLQGGSANLRIKDWNVTLSIINTAFSAFGDDDLGHLIVSRNLCRDLTRNAKNADLRVALAHHPAAWWHNDCRDTWEAIERGHDFFLTGHEHRGKIGSSAATTEGGKCHFVAAGASDEDTDGSVNQIFLLDCNRSADGLGFRASRLRVSLSGSGGVFPFPDELTDEAGHFPKNGQPEYLRALVSPTVNTRALTSPVTKSVALDTPIDFLEHLAHELSVEIFSHHSETHPESAKFSLYWPVRLRPPNIVHAVQTFIAAALCKRGVTVYLCFDDLGTIDGYASRDVGLKMFKRQVKTWAEKVTDASIASELLSNSISFNEFLGGTHTPPQEGVLKQLGSNLVAWLVAKEKLQAVLLESKLMENEDDLSSALVRRPRRLLTPPVVWTVLQLLHAQSKDKLMLTLGGVDEKPIWQAFETVDTGAMSLTNILIPRVSTTSQASDSKQQEVAMDSDLLKIRSKNEALKAIEPNIEERKEWFTKFGWHLPEIVSKKISKSLEEKLSCASDEIASEIVLM